MNNIKYNNMTSSLRETNSVESFYTANSSVSGTAYSKDRLSPIIELGGKSYHLTVYHKEPNQSEWKEITNSYLKLANKVDFQEILQKQIKVPCKTIEITTSIYPNTNSVCNIQDANGRTRKIAGFMLTDFQNAKIFKILEKIKNPRSISSSSLSKESLETLNASSIKMSLEEIKLEKTQSYLEQAAKNRKDLYKPVGFKNKSMNCGFNSCLQMILNEPVLLDIYITVATYHFKSAKAEDRLCGEQMLSILEAYDQAIEEQKPISEEVSNKLRLAMHYLNPKGMSPKPSIQEDANEILTILFAKNDDIMKKQGLVNTSSINYKFQNVTHYKCKRALQGKTHKDYSSLNPDNTYRKERSNYGIKINFDPQQKDYKLGSLLKKYFCDEDIGTGSELRRYMVNGVYTEVSPVKEEIKLNVLPRDLFINFARFKADRTKFTSPIEIPEQLDAKLLNVKDHPDGLYELSSFVVHLGATLNGGHYIAYRKIEDQWMKCNDGKVSYLSKKEMLNAVKDSYICFYKLKEDLSK